MLTLLNRLGAVAIAIMLFAPAIRARFDTPELYVYYLPFAAFTFIAAISGSVNPTALVARGRHALLFLLMMTGPFFAYFIGGGTEFALLKTLALNMSVGVAIVFYPWNLKALDDLLRALAIGGALLAVNTLVFYGSDELLAEFDDRADAAYLAASFAMGVGLLSATYTVLRSFSPISLLLFAINLLGLATGRGRGALLFGAFVTVLYLMIALNSRMHSFRGLKKIVLLVLLASFLPIAFNQAMSMQRNSEGLARILFETEVELEEGGRGPIMQTALDKISEAPLVGNGLGAYVDDDYGHPHNVILQWGVDAGLVGMLSLGLFLGCIARLVLRSLSIGDPRTINLVYAFAALWVYVMLNHLKSSDAYFARELYILCAFPIAAHLALVTARLPTRQRRRRRRHPSGGRRRSRSADTASPAG